MQKAEECGIRDRSCSPLLKTSWPKDFPSRLPTIVSPFMEIFGRKEKGRREGVGLVAELMGSFSSFSFAAAASVPVKQVRA